MGARAQENAAPGVTSTEAARHRAGRLSPDDASILSKSPGVNWPDLRRTDYAEFWRQRRAFLLAQAEHYQAVTDG